MICLFIKFKKNQQGTILLLTFLILASVLTVGIGISNLVLVNLKMGGTQARATKAYYAAEAGAEQILWEIRKQGMRPGDFGFQCEKTGSDFCFNNTTWRIYDCEPCNRIDCPACGADYIVTLNNSSSFRLHYEHDDTHPLYATTTLISFGSYGDTNRTIELTY